MSTIHVNGHAGDTAQFFDSPGNDTFYAANSGQPAAGMYGGGYANSAAGFGTNVGYATNGGSDTAYFFDSPGNDTFYAYADYAGSGKPAAGMYGSFDGGYCQLGHGFRHQRRLCDRGWQRYRLPLRFAGQGHVLCLRRLRQQRQAGGRHVRKLRRRVRQFGQRIPDRRRLFDQRRQRYGVPVWLAAERYVLRLCAITAIRGRPSAGMFGGAPGTPGHDGGFAESASGFGTNLGYAIGGGSDTAYFYDSPGNDTFYAYGDYDNSGETSAGMFGSFGGGYANEATGFGTNVGISTEGGSDTAYFYDSPGNDTFYAYANFNNSGRTSAGMYGSYGGGYANSASGFAANIGNSAEGGDDTAYLFGSSGKNALYTDLAIAELYGSSYGEQASGFGLVNASAPASGVNTHLEGPGALDYQLNLIGLWA